MSRRIFSVLLLAAAIAFWMLQPVGFAPIPESTQPTSAVESPLIVRDVGVRTWPGVGMWTSGQFWRASGADKVILTAMMATSSRIGRGAGWTARLEAWLANDSAVISLSGFDFQGALIAKSMEVGIKKRRNRHGRS